MTTPRTRVSPLVTIHPWSLESIGSSIISAGGNTYYNSGIGAGNVWPLANLAIFIPFEIFTPSVALKMRTLNGGTVNGNIDVGIYNEDGTRLVSMGSTVQAGISSWQEFDIADTTLGIGIYYMAVAMDNILGKLRYSGYSFSLLPSITGMAQMAAAFALPATVTFATCAYNYIPMMAVTTRVLW
jgi:hypothetical protein